MGQLNVLETRTMTLRPPRTRTLVCLPAYNEEKYIGTVVLKARQFADEVIVVDDGSTDRTAEVAALAGATVIRHGRNKGYGASIQTVLSEAKKRDYEVVVILDADSQHDPDEIPRFIGPILKGADLVIGSRAAHKSSIPRYRRIGQWVLSQASRVLSRQKVADSESGFRAISRKGIAELELRQNGFAIETEMIAEAAEKNLEIAEVPISVSYGKDGSTLNPVVHGLGNLGAIAAMISERRPLFFFGVFGLVAAVLGIVAGVIVLQAVGAGNEISVGMVSLSVLLLIIGVVSIFTGIILNVLAKRK